MSCLEVLPRNRKRSSLWKMVRSLFFGHKTVSKVNNIRKKAIVKRRSTFDRPSSSYVYPVVQKRAHVRESVASSDEDTVDGVTSQELPVSNRSNVQEDIADPEGRISHVITLAQIEFGGNDESVEEIQESNFNSNEDSEQFYECNNINNTTIQPPSSPASNGNRSQSEFPMDEILELFDVTVRIEKHNSSRSINRLNGNQSSLQSSQGSDENINETNNTSENVNEMGNASENVNEMGNASEIVNEISNASENALGVSSTAGRKRLRSQSMIVGVKPSPDGVVVGLERRKSYIEVCRDPPITLSYIPSGLQIDDRVIWVTESGPENGTVRWIGKIREQFYAGVELDKPVGNSSGIYGYGPGLFKRLFTCKLSYGRFVPVKELVLYSDYHDNGLKAGIICIICRDDFLETWEPCAESAGGSDSGKMVATKDCGHLFHAGCLKEWFSKKNYDHQPCPYCQHPMNRNDVIRIFPAQF